MNDQELIDEVSHAGELLIRAAAVLGSLTDDQKKMLMADQRGLEMVSGLTKALAGAEALSPDLGKSMVRHPPSGFAAFCAG